MANGFTLMLGSEMPMPFCATCPLAVGSAANSWIERESAWLEFSQIKPRGVQGGRLQELLGWVKNVSQQFRGAMLSTILRDDGYAFSTIGGYVERADNTARILDMK